MRPSSFFPGANAFVGPLDQGEHLSMPYDHIADADVLSALDPAHPQAPACTPVLPVVGG